MASIIFSIAAQSRTFTVSAPDTTRIVNALKSIYDPEDNLTGPQVFDLWASRSMQALKDVVKRAEGDAAAEAARAAIVDVAAT